MKTKSVYEFKTYTLCNRLLYCGADDRARWLGPAVAEGTAVAVAAAGTSVECLVAPVSAAVEWAWGALARAAGAPET